MDKKKSLPYVPEPTPEPDKFRYVCHGCTKNALFSTSLMQGIQVTCPHCGLQQETNPDNWVIL